MRKIEDIKKSITDDLLCGDSTVYFEHGFTNFPVIEGKTIVGVDNTHIYTKMGNKMRLKSLKKESLIKIENTLKNYFKFVAQTV